MGAVRKPVQSSRTPLVVWGDGGPGGAHIDAHVLPENGEKIREHKGHCGSFQYCTFPKPKQLQFCSVFI